MENFLLFTLTSILLIFTPGPGNILAISRGISQGAFAACISALASGAGILIHVLFATLGLTALLLASSLAFTVVKIIGAAYLIWLGLKAILAQSLISFENVEKASAKSIIISGFLTASLSPKIGVFMLAFIPQFIGQTSSSVTTEMALLGSWFAFLTVLVFSLMGFFANMLTGWLKSRPKAVRMANQGGGVALIASGTFLVFAKQ
ncbi:LysE family translocator [Paraglaciecola sp.]|uniref:LysE family translocator n=1 Tax=Paraglaciecola sp. TaxID=1920173 RepID=UPI0030F489CF